jgi:hypothetical protein
LHTESFEDDAVVVSEGGHVGDLPSPQTGFAKAQARAEELATAGAKEVKLWKLVGIPVSKVIVEWEQKNA